MLHRRLKVTAAVAGVALLVAACGGGQGGSAKGSADAADEGTPQAGGSVIYGIENESNGGWCLPESQLAISGIQVARAIYDTLMVPAQSGEMMPFLATSVTPNDTFDRWTIKLRKGVKFHDGTDLTAEVVKNNLDAYRGKYEGRSATLFSFVFDNVDTVKATDPLTVTVTTKTPWPSFPNFLFFEGRIGIMGQSQLDDATNCDKALVGTGPFRKREWKLNNRFVAEKNADYWQTDADGTRLPYLDEITFVSMLNDGDSVESLQMGRYDLMHTSTGEDLERVEALADAGTINVLSTSDFADVTYVMFNESKPPFDNMDARLAVSQAIDRDEFVKLRTAGRQPVASGPFAPGSIGYLKNSGFPAYNLDEAKQHVAAYERETGKQLGFTMLHGGDPGSLTSMELVQSQLAEVGIDMKLTPADQAALIDQVIAGGFDAVFWRNHPGGDPDGQFVWWRSDSPVNFGRYQDPTIDRLLAAGRAEPDVAKRKTIYEDLNRRFAQQAHNVWLMWSAWAVSSQPKVHGILGPDIDGEPPFEGLAVGHPVSGLWVEQ
ncbi:MAG: ABC transporter substrate-binding protein [Candidatus Microthrix parvicella]